MSSMEFCSLEDGIECMQENKIHDYTYNYTAYGLVFYFKGELTPRVKRAALRAHKNSKRDENKEIIPGTYLVYCDVAEGVLYKQDKGKKPNFSIHTAKEYTYAEAMTVSKNMTKNSRTEKCWKVKRIR